MGLPLDNEREKEKERPPLLAARTRRASRRIFGYYHGQTSAINRR